MIKSAKSTVHHQNETIPYKPIPNRIYTINAKENRVHSTITKEAGSKLNPISEPFVPTWSLEHASSNTSSSHGDRDVKPFDPKEFHEK
ncbi:hypothetical protein R6Q57_030040, partial [Mikania cordata]